MKIFKKTARASSKSPIRKKTYLLIAVVILIGAGFLAWNYWQNRSASAYSKGLVSAKYKVWQEGATVAYACQRVILYSDPGISKDGKLTGGTGTQSKIEIVVDRGPVKQTLVAVPQVVAAFAYTEASPQAAGGFGAAAVQSYPYNFLATKWEKGRYAELALAGYSYAPVNKKNQVYSDKIHLHVLLSAVPGTTSVLATFPEVLSITVNKLPACQYDIPPLPPTDDKKPPVDKFSSEELENLKKLFDAGLGDIKF